MGAMLWEHIGPWHDDPAESLRRLQASYFADNYDLAAYLREQLENAKQAVEATEVDDKYGLFEVYEEQLSLVQEACENPLPADPQAQIELLRKLEAISGQGIGNVLDVKTIAQTREPLMAECLNLSEMDRLVGTQRPTLANAKEAVHTINSGLGRGECVCFPYYDDEGNPLGWYFVGNTID